MAHVSGRMSVNGIGPSGRQTPKSSNKLAMVKGKAALSKFLGIHPNDKDLSVEDKENYNGWMTWMKEQVRLNLLRSLSLPSRSPALLDHPTLSLIPHHNRRTIPMR